MVAASVRADPVRLRRERRSSRAQPDNETVLSDEKVDEASWESFPASDAPAGTVSKIGPPR